MKDRISLHPGRVRLVPVPGQEHTYDLVRADEPTQEGTALNKETLLKDATAAALGLTADALPDDALNKVKGLIDKAQAAANAAQSRADNTFTKTQTLTDATRTLYGLSQNAVPNDVLGFLGKYNQYWWKRRTYRSHYELDSTILQPPFSPFGYSSGTVEYSNGYKITADGKISLAAPITTITLNMSNYPSYTQTLKNKYCCCYTNDHINVFYIKTSSDLNISTSGGNPVFYGTIENLSKKLVEEYGSWEYIRATDRNVYPDSGIKSGYEYQFLGRPFENMVKSARIATGSYVGTGAYGSNDPCRLTFEFVPRFVCVGNISKKYYDVESSLTLPCYFLKNSYSNYGYQALYGGYANSPQYAYAKIDGTSLLWYNRDSAMYQANENGKTYDFFALG